MLFVRLTVTHPSGRVLDGLALAESEDDLESYQTHVKELLGSKTGYFYLDRGDTNSIAVSLAQIESIETQILQPDDEWLTAWAAEYDVNLDAAVASLKGS